MSGNVGTNVATLTAGTRAGEIIQSIRAMIPDPVTTPSQDGGAFTLNTLLRWINDGMRIMASKAPVIQDWSGLQSQANMDVYNLPTTVTSVEQAWYDLWPLNRSAEYNALFTSKVNGRSFYFGPHAVHYQPRLHVWPAASRTGATTTTGASLTVSETSSVTLTSTSNMNAYGFIQVESEIIMYRTVTSSTVLSNLLRGQAGTTAAAHSNGAAVTELNIMYKCSRLPTPITGPDDIIEIPVGLQPLIELYVMSKVREAEQDHGTAMQMRQEFNSSVDMLASKAPVPGLRQGIQVQPIGGGPALFHGGPFGVIVP